MWNLKKDNKLGQTKAWMLQIKFTLSSYYVARYHNYIISHHCVIIILMCFKFATTYVILCNHFMTIALNLIYIITTEATTQPLTQARIMWLTPDQNYGITNKSQNYKVTWVKFEILADTNPKPQSCNNQYVFGNIWMHWIQIQVSDS